MCANLHPPPSILPLPTATLPLPTSHFLTSRLPPPTSHFLTSRLEPPAANHQPPSSNLSLSNLPPLAIRGFPTSYLSPSLLRSFCRYAFGPGGCRGDPSILPDLLQDLANFLLIRGPYSWLGHGWLGCSRDYVFPPQLQMDYGEPMGLCSETAPGSNVFARDWTKATVQMDCNKWEPTITWKAEREAVRE